MKGDITKEICQACGQNILSGEPIITVSYGMLVTSKAPSAKWKGYYSQSVRHDIFHQRCHENVAIL